MIKKDDKNILINLYEAKCKINFYWYLPEMSFLFWENWCICILYFLDNNLSADNTNFYIKHFSIFIKSSPIFENKTNKIATCIYKTIFYILHTTYVIIFLLYLFKIKLYFYNYNKNKTGYIISNKNDYIVRSFKFQYNYNLLFLYLIIKNEI